MRWDWARRPAGATCQSPGKPYMVDEGGFRSVGFMVRVAAALRCRPSRSQRCLRPSVPGPRRLCGPAARRGLCQLTSASTRRWSMGRVELALCHRCCSGVCSAGARSATWRNLRAELRRRNCSPDGCGRGGTCGACPEARATPTGRCSTSPTATSNSTTSTPTTTSDDRMPTHGVRRHDAAAVPLLGEPRSRQSRRSGA